MALTYSQKRYIQDHYGVKTPAELAGDIGSSIDDVLRHIQKNDLTPMLKPDNLEMGTKPPFSETYAYLAMLAIVVVLVYLNGMFGTFVSDDVYVLVNDEYIYKTWDYFLLSPTMFIRNALYFFTYHAVGLVPAAYKIWNLLFHIGFVWMVYFVMPFFSKKKYLPLIVALFAAVHPMMIESVTWISGGIYAQAGFFGMLSFYLYLRDRASPSYKLHVGSVIMFLCAVSSSEKVIVFPIVILLYEFIYGFQKGAWYKVAAYFTISFLWGLTLLARLDSRLTSLQVLNGYDKKVQYINPFLQIPVALNTYFKLFVWPRHLTIYQSEFEYTVYQFAGYVIVTISYFGIAIGNYFKNKAVCFWMLTFFISLLVTLNPLGLSWIVAERYAYFGSIGLYFSFTVLMYQLIDKPKFKVAGYTIITFLLIIFSIRTVVRNIDWISEDNLWPATAKASPSDPKTHNNLGDVYARQGDLQKAGESFAKALSLNPNYPDAYHNLANIYRSMGNPDAALDGYTRAVELNPDLWQSQLNIAAIYFDKGEYDKALEYAMKTASLVPNNAPVIANVGVIYLRKGEFEKARYYFNEALKVSPQDPTALQGLATPELNQ